MKKIKLFIIFTLITTLFSSCIIVKKFESEDRPPVVKLSPKPTIPMQDDVLRAKDGDMIAAIPQGWFYVELDDDAPVGTFAVATNPDYSLTAVFKKIRSNAALEKAFEEENVIGAAKFSYTKKAEKTNGRCQLNSKYQTVEAGNLSFGKYNYSTTGGAVIARTAVFKSNLNNYYELTIFPTDIKGKAFPSEKEQDEIFNSIIATIKY